MDMLKRFISFLPWLIVLEGVSMAIGYSTSPNADNPAIMIWYQTLTKSPLNPPNYIFPIIWSVLYGMIAYALWRVWTYAYPRPLSFVVFAATHIILNWSWSFVFFAGQDIYLGFGWLVLVLITSAILMIWSKDYDRRAAIVLAPYVLWLGFASYLNWYLVQMN